MAGWLLSKKENPSAGERREKLEPLCITGGNAKWHQLPRKMIGSVLKKKKKKKLSYEPAIALPGIYPKELKSRS